MSYSPRSSYLSNLYNARFLRLFTLRQTSKYLMSNPPSSSYCENLPVSKPPRASSSAVFPVWIECASSRPSRAYPSAVFPVRMNCASSRPPRASPSAVFPVWMKCASCQPPERLLLLMPMLSSFSSSYNPRLCLNSFSHLFFSPPLLFSISSFLHLFFFHIPHPIFRFCTSKRRLFRASSQILSAMHITFVSYR